MTDDSRIEELRRRIRKDPASLAFAQLAEELRRGRRYAEAVGVCRAGLATYPTYLSARVTLGRCLIDLNRLDDAQRELEKVREVAPENLVAVRALAEIHERRSGDAAEVPLRQAPDASGRTVEVAGATPPGAASEVRRKPITMYNAALPDVRLKPDPTSEEAVPRVELKPAATYEAGEVRLKPDQTTEGTSDAAFAAGEVSLKPDTTYEGEVPDVRLTPDTTYEAKPEATYEATRDAVYQATPDAAYEAMPDATYDDETARTLAALESLLAAIHVTRASRSA